jgi:hypothetical protein
MLSSIRPLRNDVISVTILFLGAFRKMAPSCLLVRVEELGSHWTYFHEIDIWVFFEKSVEKIQVSLQCDKNNVHFPWT